MRRSERDSYSWASRWKRAVTTPREPRRLASKRAAGSSPAGTRPRRGGETATVAELCELAPILAEASRHDDIRRAALRLPEICRWRDALLLTADRDTPKPPSSTPRSAASPLAADAHLLAARQAAQQGRRADTSLHITAVLAFADETGAVLYRRQAEQLTAASA